MLGFTIKLTAFLLFVTKTTLRTPSLHTGAFPLIRSSSDNVCKECYIIGVHSQYGELVTFPRHGSLLEAPVDPTAREPILHTDDGFPTVVVGTPQHLRELVH